MMPMMVAMMLVQAAAPAASGPWTMVERIDPANGHKSVTASATAIDGSARLVLRCDAAVPIVSMQFLPKVSLGASEEREVAVSFDGGAPYPYKWEFPANATFVREAGIVTTLAMLSARAQRIGISTTSATGEAVSASFPGPGEARVKAVLAACGYQLGVVPTLAAAPAAAAPTAAAPTATSPAPAKPAGSARKPAQRKAKRK